MPETDQIKENVPVNFAPISELLSNISSMVFFRFVVLQEEEMEGEELEVEEEETHIILEPED